MDYTDNDGATWYTVEDDVWEAVDPGLTDPHGDSFVEDSRDLHPNCWPEG